MLTFHTKREPFIPKNRCNTKSATDYSAHESNDKELNIIEMQKCIVSLAKYTNNPT